MNYLTRRKFIKNTCLATTGLALGNVAWKAGGADYSFYSLKRVSELIESKKISPLAITQACLKRIALLNPQLNAFITITAEQALKDAEVAEIEIKKGKWKGPLHGIPVALKDNIDTAGVLTTAASAVYKNRIPTEDAQVVKRLKKAGAIIIGKTNMHEFALGTTSHISHFGAVKNPWHTEYIPGGSSGGSAVAVAAGCCYAAIGTDTGGSNRLPAACCGITGLKPSFDLISTEGIIPAVKSLDHTGVFARTVEDAVIVLNEIAEMHPANGKLNLKPSIAANLRSIGIVSNFKASNEAEILFDKAVAVFKNKGFSMSPVELPKLPQNMNFVDAELQAYHQPLIATQAMHYSPEIWKGLKELKPIENSLYLDQKMEMEKWRAKISETLFREIDVLILPTLTAAPITIKEAQQTGSFALDDSNTFPFNYYGLPAISIPCGFFENGLPAGLQIVGPRWGEQQVIDAAHYYQNTTKWHRQYPIIKL
jgi:aspartyl-tRNA(Asn)/glutamyl-tRNA(Gln) amidotransferase subunit A